jgi:hypothetical protein
VELQLVTAAFILQPDKYKSVRLCVSAYMPVLSRRTQDVYKMQQHIVTDLLKASLGDRPLGAF